MRDTVAATCVVAASMRPTALAGDGDLPPFQVHVTELAVTGGCTGSRSPGTPR